MEEMIDAFALEKYLSTNAEKLPFGYKQRLSLACANMHQPSILFLDEPTSGVDPITRREFWNHINGLVTKGVTIMITTHFMEEAEYCDKIAFIYQGKIINVASSTEVKQEFTTKENCNPTLEDAFVAMIENVDRMQNGRI
jgi:ABC-2 type transport system ATP-binding protein